MTRIATVTLVLAGGYAGHDIQQHVAGDTYKAGYRDSQKDLERIRYTYTDVAVVARHDATHFTLQPARMAPFEATTCQPVDWQDSEKMRVLVYQQDFEKHCKDVGARGAYEFYTHKNGRRIKFEEVADAGY